MPERAQDQALKVAAAVVVALVFTLALVLGRNAQTKAAKNFQIRLDSTRLRFQNCEAERKMLSGETQGQGMDELRLAEDDHQALQTENGLLSEDNEHLREENYALEKQIDELRDELNYKDFVSDDEVKQLEDTMALGNNSQQLQELLDDYQLEGGINKDKLIEKLVAELKRKRLSLRKCKATKGWNGKMPSEKTENAEKTDTPAKPAADKNDATTKPKPKIIEETDKTWDELTSQERKEELASATKIIGRVQMQNSTRATKLIKEWVKTHPGGLDDLKASVKEYVTTKMKEAVDAA